MAITPATADQQIMNIFNFDAATGRIATNDKALIYLERSIIILPIFLFFMNLFSVPKKFTCAFILLLLFFSSQGQKATHENFSKQLSFITENDFFLMQGKDGYYTNGIMFNYSTSHRSKKPSFIKQVDQFELGQKIFTAYSRKIHTPDQIDRPVTGYLYGQFLRTGFLKRRQFLQWGISAGTIGKASLGEALQNSYHKLIHINTSEWGWVWDYQLKSAFGINLHAKYGKALVEHPNSLIQVTPVTQLSLGSFFTNASESVLFQFGKMNLQHKSVYWNAAVSDEPESYRPELFFYYYPQLTWQLYNATVQGGLFAKNKGPIISDPEPFVLLQQLGAMYSFKRYSFRLAVTFKSEVAKSQRFNHKYGSLQFNYRFN